jgi:hypothetical protein
MIACRHIGFVTSLVAGAVNGYEVSLTNKTVVDPR